MRLILRKFSKYTLTLAMLKKKNTSYFTLFFFFHTKSLKRGVHLTLTAHLDVDETHVWLPCWTEQVQESRRKEMSLPPTPQHCVLLH